MSLNDPFFSLDKLFTVDATYTVNWQFSFAYKVIEYVPIIVLGTSKVFAPLACLSLFDADALSAPYLTYMSRQFLFWLFTFTINVLFGF